MVSDRSGSIVTQVESSAGNRPIELVGDSAELVALALLRQIAQLEHKTLGVIDRDWILDTYQECLAAVRGTRAPGAGALGQPSASRARNPKRGKAN